jgi:hypothetical protein
LVQGHVALNKREAIYRLGEEVTFEMKVHNTGKDTVIIPWTPHLGDLEPADPDVPYKYRIGVVLLTFRDSEGRQFSLSESLYGSENSAGTLRDLLPGQWFVVRGRERIEPDSPDWGQGELREIGWATAKVSGYFRQDEGSYSPENGGAVSALCIPLRSTGSNAMDVTLESR